MPGLHANRGAKRAREARADLGLDAEAPLRCVVEAVEQRAGVPVVVAALGPGVAGACWRDGERRVVWVNARQAVARQRFTVAHELGHLRLGHGGARIVDTPATLRDEHDPLEIEANAFAAELLAPKAAIARLVPREPGLPDVVRLAVAYGLSAPAALMRVQAAGLLSALRAAQLRDELREGGEAHVRAHLGAAEVDDVLGRLGSGDLPRLPAALAGSALAALLRGEVTAEAAADAAGADRAVLAAAAADIAR